LTITETKPREKFGSFFVKLIRLRKRLTPLSLKTISKTKKFGWTLGTFWSLKHKTNFQPLKNLHVRKN